MRKSEQKKKTKDILFRDRCLCILENSDESLLECDVVTLLRNNKVNFRGCCNRRDVTFKLEQILIFQRMKDLVKEAGLDWPTEYVRNLASYWKDVFRECETREEAIQRLHDLAPIITFS